MPFSSSFSVWFGELFDISASEVNQLLTDKTALHFLVAWSLFESKCFDGFVKLEKIEIFVKKSYSSINCTELLESIEYFHSRYQCSSLFKNLMHKQKDKRLSTVLKKSFNEIECEDRLYFLVFVIYRYRNNIFHGNKGVQYWLQYRDQIEHCTRAIQVMVSHAESIKPTMKIEAT